jgi:hypothetical protein
VGSASAISVEFNATSDVDTAASATTTPIDGTVMCRAGCRACST